MQVLVSSVKIPERVRKDLGNIESLMDSMKKCGQLNPVTITRDMELVTGHRRIMAATRLGWKMIDATIVDGVDETKRLEMEMEENFCRKDFSPEELLAGYKKLEELRHPSFGRRLRRSIRGLFSRLAFWRRRRKQAFRGSESVASGSDPAIKTIGASAPVSSHDDDVYCI